MVPGRIHFWISGINVAASRRATTSRNPLAPLPRLLDVKARFFRRLVRPNVNLMGKGGGGESHVWRWVLYINTYFMSEHAHQYYLLLPGLSVKIFFIGLSSQLTWGLKRLSKVWAPHSLGYLLETLNSDGGYRRYLSSLEIQLTGTWNNAWTSDPSSAASSVFTTWKKTASWEFLTDPRFLYVPIKLVVSFSN